MKSIKAIELTLTCILFAAITAMSSTQAAIFGGSIKNDNIKENHRHLKKKCKDKKGKLNVKGMVDKFSCKKLATMGLCNERYKKGRKTKIFDKCPNSCNIDTEGEFKVKGIEMFKKKITCEKIKRKKACNKKQKNGRPLFNLCPISCEKLRFCEEENVPSQVPTESPTESPTEFSIPPSSLFPSYVEESCLIRNVDILDALDNAFGEENCSVTSEFTRGRQGITITTSCSVCPTPGYYTTKMTYTATIADCNSGDEPCPLDIEYVSTYPNNSFMETGDFEEEGEGTEEGGEGAIVLSYLSDVKKKIRFPPVPPSDMPSQMPGASPSFKCYE